jgi:hypothetical protein
LLKQFLPILGEGGNVLVGSGIASIGSFHVTASFWSLLEVR